MRKQKKRKNKQLLRGHHGSKSVINYMHGTVADASNIAGQTGRQTGGGGGFASLFALASGQSGRKEKAAQPFIFPPRNTTIIKGGLAYRCVLGLVSAFKISDVSPAGLKTCAVFTGLINSQALKPVRGFFFLARAAVCVASVLPRAAICCVLYRERPNASDTFSDLSYRLTHLAHPCGLLPETFSGDFASRLSGNNVRRGSGREGGKRLRGDKGIGK